MRPWAILALVTACVRPVPVDPIIAEAREAGLIVIDEPAAHCGAVLERIDGGCVGEVGDTQIHPVVDRSCAVLGRSYDTTDATIRINCPASKELCGRRVACDCSFQP